MVFYRKYRPQIIDDLDSAVVRETLTSVLKQNPPHAFLFTGPKGLGKTSTARIIAKSINCTGRKKGQVEPCNECEQCQSITNNTNVDILEIDAASNRGIDEIRDLKEKIRLAPVASRQKIYIIDEVHMLTTEAFNALLKTLEEPPAHAMFILCTTEPQKIPSTILSRCFHISFKLATPEELVRSFGRIIKNEHVDVDTDALMMIADLSEGGFRDGVKILEEVITLSGGKKVTKAFVEEKFQVSTIAGSVRTMLACFETKDVTQGLELISMLVAQGIDMKYFLQKIMEALHVGLLQQVAAKAPQSNGLQLGDMKKLFTLLTRANAEMKYAVLPQLPLELVLLEWCDEASQSPQEAAKDSVLAGDTTVTVQSLRKHISSMKRMKVLYGDKSVPAPEKTPQEPKETTTVELTKTSGEEVTEEWLAHFWKNFIYEMQKHNHTLAGLLRGCKIKKFSKEELIIEAAYKFHKEKLDETKNRDALLKACKILTGNAMEIHVELRK